MRIVAVQTGLSPSSVLGGTITDREFLTRVADRGASVRVPHSFVNNGHKGYLEDRRPNSLGDPYRIAGRIIQTIATVPTADPEVSERVPEEVAA